MSCYGIETCCYMILDYDSLHNVKEQERWYAINSTWMIKNI